MKVILRTLIASGGNPVILSGEGVAILLDPRFSVMGTCLKGGCFSVAFGFACYLHVRLGTKSASVDCLTTGEGLLDTFAFSFSVNVL